MAANSRLAVAAHIVAVLAANKDEWTPSAYVAKSVNTHPVVIRRLLAKLTQAGIVRSNKGHAGGSRLAKCPDRISLWDLAEALGEEHLFQVHRNPANPKCPISCRMKEALGTVFAEAERAAQAKLKKMKVSRLLAGGE